MIILTLNVKSLWNIGTSSLIFISAVFSHSDDTSQSSLSPSHSQTHCSDSKPDKRLETRADAPEELNDCSVVMAFRDATEKQNKTVILLKRDFSDWINVWKMTAFTIDPGSKTTQMTKKTPAERQRNWTEQIKHIVWIHNKQWPGKTMRFSHEIGLLLPTTLLRLQNNALKTTQNVLNATNKVLLATTPSQPSKTCLQLQNAFITTH